MIFIRIKGHFDDKIFLTKFKDISQNSRTFHGFQGFPGHCGNPALVNILMPGCPDSLNEIDVFLFITKSEEKA